MMVKIILLVLGVAALATAEVADHLNHDLSPADEVNRLSQEVSAAMSSVLSPMLNRYKSRLTCQLNAIDKFKNYKTVADCTKGGKVALCLCIRYCLMIIHTHDDCCKLPGLCLPMHRAYSIRIYLHL